MARDCGGVQVLGTRYVSVYFLHCTHENKYRMYGATIDADEGNEGGYVRADSVFNTCEWRMCGYFVHVLSTVLCDLGY
jgi:hypothetical protein